MDEFALCWNNFADNIASGFQNLYDRGDLVDVTIACDGKLLKAHKIVLAICSPYFQEMFMTNPCKHPIIVLKDVSLNVMQELLQFMYQGEVNVKHSELQSFMKIAETLQIKGLTASHKNDRGSASPAHPAPAHSSSNLPRPNLKDLGVSSTSQLDPSKLGNYLMAAAKENLKRAADGSIPAADQYPIHYPKKTLKRSSESTEQESNSDCMDNLSSDEVFIPTSPQISMVEQSPTARQFDLSAVKRENTNDSMSSPQQSPTNLATSAANMSASAAAAAAGLGKLGITSTPIHHPSLLFGAFDHNSTSFSGIANNFGAAMGGATPGNGSVSVTGGKLEHANDYSQDYAKGIGPGHMDIPAVAPGEKWFQGRLQFMLSQRGKPLLVHDGHSFGIQYVRKDKKYWQCNLSRKYNCKARVTTTDTGDIIVTNNEHCHTEIRQHLRKDYKSMKQLNASLAALRARQQEAINLGLGGVSSAESSHNSMNIGHSSNNNNPSIPNNNNKLALNVSNNIMSPMLPLEQQPEQETSLNLSTSNWQLKNEPMQNSE